MSDGRRKQALAITTLLLGVVALVFPYRPSVEWSLAGLRVSVPQIFLIAGGVLLFAAGPTTWRRLLLFPRSVWIPALTVAGWMIGSTLLSHYVPPERAVSLVSVGVVASAFSLLNTQWRRRWFRLWAWLVVVSSLLGVVQYYISPDVAPAVHLGYSGRADYAAVGFANFSSLFGFQLAAAISVFSALWVWHWEGRRTLWAAAATMGTAALVLTYSRSAWAAAVVGIAVLFALAAGRRRRVAAVVVVGAVIAAAITMMPVPSWRAEGTLAGYTPRHRWENDVAEPLRAPFADGSFQIRKELHEAGWRMATRSVRTLIAGTGVRSFRERWANWRDAEAVAFDGRDRIDAHSMYVETFVAGGIIALGAFAVLLVSLARELRQLVTTSPLAQGLFAAFVAILVSGAFNTWLYTKFLWIVVGVIGSLLLTREQHRE